MNDLKFSQLVRANDILGKSLGTKDSISIKVLSNITINQLTPALEYVMRSSGINASVQIGDYDNIIQESASIKSEIPIIFWEPANFKTSFVYEIETYSDEMVQEFTDKIETELTILFKNLQTSKLVILNKFSGLVFTAGLARKGKFEKFIEGLNEFVANAVPSNFVLIDIDKCIASVSVANSINLRNFYSAKSLYTFDFLKCYAEFISPILRSLLGKSKKALIFDCDNTLWKGILGEDGPTQVALSEKQKNGLFFNEVQILARSLADRGVIIGLCSKNNLKDVDDLFSERTDMVLTDSDIVIKKINWDNKASNLQAIAKELNIGIDSLVFVDDSPFELNLIKETIPAVETIAVPGELHEYPQTILKASNYFYSISESAEDKNRVGMYKQEMQRVVEKQAITNIDDYLNSLGIKMVMENKSDQISERVAQLTQKTNQFNLTTIRYSHNDILQFYQSGDFDVITIDVSDKYGESGVTGVCILKYETEYSVTIDTFLMSCRILGRNIEKAFAVDVVKRLEEKGVKKIHARYSRTPKNVQVENFYDDIGFELVERGDDSKTYVASPDDLLKKDFNIKYIETIWKKK